MKPDLYKEATKIWQQLTNGSREEELKFELDVYRKLLNFFMVGDYYYYIFDVKKAAFNFVSGEVTNVLGYRVEEINVPFFISKMHPEDQPWFLNFENMVTQFFKTLSFEQIPNYKVSYDYRVRKKNGDYIRILQQVITIQYDKENPVIRTLGIHTDISHFKKEGHPVLSLIGLNGEPSYMDVKADALFNVNYSGMSKREYQILHKLAEGKSSNEISALFFISKATVKTHRKNILKKTGCINTAELMSLAVKKGWI